MLQPMFKCFCLDSERKYTKQIWERVDANKTIAYTERHEQNEVASSTPWKDQWMIMILYNTHIRSQITTTTQAQNQCQALWLLNTDVLQRQNTHINLAKTNDVHLHFNVGATPGQMLYQYDFCSNWSAV